MAYHWPYFFLRFRMKWIRSTQRTKSPENGPSSHQTFPFVGRFHSPSRATRSTDRAAIQIYYVEVRKESNGFFLGLYCHYSVSSIKYALFHKVWKSRKMSYLNVMRYFWWFTVSVIPGVPTSAGQEFSKNSQNFKKSEKNCESLFIF